MEEQKRVFNNWLVKRPGKKDRWKGLELKLIFDLQKTEWDGWDFQWKECIYEVQSLNLKFSIQHSVNQNWKNCNIIILFKQK